MNKQELVRRLAKASGITQARAADRIDRAIHRVLLAARKGGKPNGGKSSRA